MKRVVEYLHTRDRRIFPFTSRFDKHLEAAFVRDLREGLGEINDSGSARKSSATGFIANDLILRRIIEEWQAANGGWPAGSSAADPRTALGSSTNDDSPEPRSEIRRTYARRVILDAK